MTQPAEVWRALLRRSLLTARKQRDTARVSALRSVLGAIDNAGRPKTWWSQRSRAGGLREPWRESATEVARRELSDEQIRHLVQSEIDERRSAAEDFAAGGRSDRAAALRAEAAILADLLGDV